MTPLTLSRIILLAGTLSVAGFTTASAQDADTTTAAPTDGAPAFHHHHGGVLTKDEWQELKKDRDQVLAANTDLAAQEKSLHEQMKALQDKIDAAIEQADPNAAALIAKLKAAHPHHGPGADADSTADSSGQ